MISGYQIVSLKNINIPTDGTSVHIDGIFNAIEGNHRKPIMLSDIVLDVVERSSRYVEFVVRDGHYAGYLAISGDVNVRIEITDEDMITVNNE